MLIWRAAVVVSFLASVLRSGGLQDVLPQTIWYALQFGSLAFAGLAILFSRKAERPPAQRNFVLPLLWALITLAGIGAAFSSRASDVLPQVGLFALVGFFLSMTYKYRWHEGRVRDGDLITIFWSVVSIHVVGLAGHFAHASWAFADYGRYVGLISNANYAGMTAAMVLPLAFRVNGIVRVSTALILFTALVLSESRGAMLAVAFAALWLLTVPVVRQRMFVITWGAVTVTIGVLLVRPGTLTGLREDLARRLERNDLSSGRIDIYSQLWTEFKTKPIFGIGYHLAQIQKGDIVTAGHNVYLTVLVELGIVGMVVFLALLVAGAKAGTRRTLLTAPALVILLIELTESSLFGFGGPTALISWILLLAFATTGRLTVREPGSGLIELEPQQSALSLG